MVEAVRHRTRGSGLDSRWGPWKISGDLILVSALSSPGDHLATNRYEYQGISLGGKVRAAHKADISAVLVVPNVTGRMEA